MKETSLEDFATAETPAEAGEADAVPETPVENDDASEPVAAPEVTAAYTPSGQPCAACDTEVEWRWRQEDSMVCAACKNW